MNCSRSRVGGERLGHPIGASRSPTRRTEVIRCDNAPVSTVSVSGGRCRDHCSRHGLVPAAPIDSAGSVADWRRRGRSATGPRRHRPTSTSPTRSGGRIAVESPPTFAVTAVVARQFSAALQVDVRDRNAESDNGRVLVEPIPGVSLEQLQRSLTDVATALANARSTTGTGLDRYNAYVRWVNDAVTRLSVEVSAADLERLVLTQRSWLLQSMPDAAGFDPTVNLVMTEIGDRLRVLDAARDAASAEIQRWRRPGVIIVPDSSFYITHSHKLQETDFASLLHLREEPVRVIVPILVVDELDGLKRSSNRHVRWRAGHTLAVLDHLLPNSTEGGVLREEDFSPLSQQTGGMPRGRVTIEILFDPPGHARLPIADDEIVGRALSAQNRRGRPVTLLTYDTGQATRARHAGLQVVKLVDEPAPT